MAEVPLSAEKIVEAITYEEQFNSKDDYLAHGLKGQKIKLASAMAMDGISKYVTFYGDWDAIAAYAADAKREMRPVTPEGIKSTGLLHAFVEVAARGALPVSKLNRRYFGNHAHLVLKTEDGKTIQPIEKEMLTQMDQTTGSTVVESLLIGYAAKKNTIEFSFNVSLQELNHVAEVILTDGDGHQHKAAAHLAGVL
jgi:hypothetical protein